MSLAQKLKTAGYWQTLQTVVKILVQFLYIGIMARLLSKADYGLMALAGGFIGMGAIFSEGGMGAALIQKKIVTQKHMSAALQGGIINGILIFSLFFIIAEKIATFFNQPALEPIIKVLGINIVFHSVSGISLGLLQKQFQFNKTAYITISSTIIGYTIGIVMALNDYGVWSLVIATVTTSFLNAISFFFMAPVKLSFNFHLKEWKELFSFGSGIILLQIANYFSDRGLNLILGKVMNANMLGIFERTSKIKIIPSLYLGKILDTIMFPTMSEIQDEPEPLYRIYQHSLGLVNSILMPFAVYLIFFSKEVVLILLGNNWLEAVLPLQIMFIVLPFSSSGRMADAVIRAKGLIYKNIARKYIYVTVLISSTSLGAYFYGITGAAIAVSFSFLFNYIIMLFLVKGIFKKKVTDIFLAPVISGVKLALWVLIMAVILTEVFDIWDHNSISKFVVVTFITGIIFGIVALKKPRLLGKYISHTIQKLLKKES